MTKLFVLSIIIFIASLWLFTNLDSDTNQTLLALLGAFLIGISLWIYKYLSDAVYRRKPHIAWLAIFYTSLSFLLIAPLFMMPSMAKQAKEPGFEETKPPVWMIWMYFVVNGLLISLGAK